MHTELPSYLNKYFFKTKTSISSFTNPLIVHTFSFPFSLTPIVFDLCAFLHKTCISKNSGEHSSTRTLKISISRFIFSEKTEIII